MLAAWFCIDTGKSDKGKQVKSATRAQRTNRLRATYTQDKQLKYTSSLLTTVRKANRILRQLFGYIFFFSQFFFSFGLSLSFEIRSDSWLRQAWKLHVDQDGFTKTPLFPLPNILITCINLCAQFAFTIHWWWSSIDFVAYFPMNH